MGTHPIFESDFDCLTESKNMSRLVLTAVRRLTVRPLCVPVYQSRSFTFSKNDENRDESKAEPASDEKEATPTMGELMAQIGEKDARIVALEEQVSETKKESQYKISSLAQEMKAQEDRLRRENEKTKVLAIKNFAKCLFPVADQFVIAMESVKAESLEQNQELKNFHDGITMTSEELKKAFENNKIIAVSPSVGDEFDHNIHEAVMKVPRANVPDLAPGQIAFVQKTGYTLEDQILRPCWVGVVAE